MTNKINLDRLFNKGDNVRVFIDTCSLLHPKLEQFLSWIVPLIAANHCKLIVPQSCIEELEKKKDDTKLKPKVEKAFNELARIQQYIERRGNEADSHHADNVFQTVFAKFRTQYRLILITEDKALRRDILTLNESKSVRGWQINVVSIGEIMNTNQPHSNANHMSRFHICTKMTNIEDAEVPISSVPKVGDTVYDKNNTPVQLLEEINKGGEGCVYKTSMGDACVAKIYFDQKLTTHKQKKIDAVIDSGLTIQGVCFPQTQLYDRQGIFVGYLMPKAEGKKLDVSVFKGEKGITRHFASWERKDLVVLAITVLSIIKRIHVKGILIGDINGANILVKSPTEVYFVDTDSFQINDFPCPVGTQEFTAPEIQDKNYKEFLRTKGNENFAVATLLFKLMMFGCSPYAQQDGSGIASNIKTGNFSFPYKENSNQKIPKGDWCFYWSHLFFKLKQHFYFTFRKGECMFDEEKRPSVEDWLKDLRFYLKQIEDGTLEGIDKESLKMFPKSYKKDKNKTYIRCKHCNEEKDSSYMYDDDTCYTCHNQLVQEAKRKKEEQRAIALEARRKEQERKREERRREQERRNAVYSRIRCSVCQREFAITNGEYEYYRSKGLDLPKRCKECREQGKRPTYNNSHSSGGGGCFLTTAVCEYFGKEDDCYELTTLRSFRDNWLSKQENGDLQISLYYNCAPRLVEKMKASPDYAETCEELMGTYIRPCIELIENHQDEACRQLYIKGLKYMLNKYK